MKCVCHHSALSLFSRLPTEMHKTRGESWWKGVTTMKPPSKITTGQTTHKCSCAWGLTWETIQILICRKLCHQVNKYVNSKFNLFYAVRSEASLHSYTSVPRPSISKTRVAPNDYILTKAMKSKFQRGNKYY